MTYIDQHSTTSDASAEQAWSVVSRLGGDERLYTPRDLWRLRGLADRLVGGPRYPVEGPRRPLRARGPVGFLGGGRGHPPSPLPAPGPYPPPLAAGAGGPERAPGAHVPGPRGRPARRRQQGGPPSAVRPRRPRRSRLLVVHAGRPPRHVRPHGAAAGGHEPRGLTCTGRGYDGRSHPPETGPPGGRAMGGQGRRSGSMSRVGPVHDAGMDVFARSVTFRPEAVHVCEVHNRAPRQGCEPDTRQGTILCRSSPR